MRIVLLLSFIVGLSAPSQLQAQTPAGREPDIRLDLSAAPAFSSLWAVPFVFQDSGLDCPDARWTMTISNGLLRTYHLNLPPMEQPTQSTFTTHLKNDPTDDFTYRLQYVRPNCRVDIDVRQHVRADGEWKSLLVIRERRPSLSEEERQEEVRRRLGDLALPRDSKPATQSDIDKINKIFGPKGPPRWGGSTFSWGVAFEDAPPSCMEVIGEYVMTKDSFAMAFFAPLPGELNKFVLEGTDLDESHARIYLTKNDCRFEFTISQSDIRDGKPVPIPFRPPPDRAKTGPITVKP
jgi:hypothetical protein